MPERMRRVVLRQAGLKLLVAAAVLTGLSCGGEGLEPPTTGNLEITTATTGPEPDADGYLLTIDGGTATPIGANATVDRDPAELRNHTVQLTGIAANCTVAGENPRRASVTAGETATVRFEVTCHATTGSLSITSTTSGPFPDPDGYTIALDGAEHGPLGVNADVTINGLAPGSHVVGLSGVAANCQVQGENPRSVTIIASESASVAYILSCAAPPQGGGSLRITTATSGPDVDPDGYTIAVDGAASQPIAVNASATLANLPPGVHAIRLAGVAPNCTVQGTNPRSVTITGGATAELSFPISCSATTGTVRVGVTTSGSPTDPDGYVAKLDGADPGKQIATDGTISFTGVPAGSHTVALSGLAANCSVTGGPSLNVTLAIGASAELSFVVTCTTITGSIQVTTATTGSALDPDGYTLSVDGGASQAIGINAMVVLEGLAVGTHALALSRFAANCHLDGENPRSVEVVPGSTTVALAVNCLGADALIAFTSHAVDLLAVFVVRPDGTGLRKLTPDGAAEGYPVWSPDGRRILFSKGEGLYVMNADGSGRAKLVDGDDDIGRTRWSPDGRMIAYANHRYPDSNSLISDLWVMRADGNGKLMLAANFADDFSWSPDSRKIAYDVENQIAIINSDGSGHHPLTSQPLGAFAPAWSPDGSRIAFVARGERLPDRPAEAHIFLISPDGSGLVDLTERGGNDVTPVWSPDGSRIVFATFGDIAVMNRDGSGRTNLTNRSGYDGSPSWSPDGSRIVYLRYENSENGDSEIYVMNADGTGQMNVSNRPETHESTPAWGGQGPSMVANSQSGVSNSWPRVLEAKRLRQ
jgi:Tol biopolymer transport system component